MHLEFPHDSNPFSDENIRLHGHPRPAHYAARSAGDLKVGDNARAPNGVIFARITEIFTPADGLVTVCVGWESWTVSREELCLVEVVSSQGTP